MRTAGDSKIATGHLLKTTAYPDTSGASDDVELAYNAQGQEIWKQDQDGNVFETGHDDQGRRAHLRVTTLDADYDGAVRRITWGYDSLGRVATVTQYNNATVGSGSVVDEVESAYDGWGNLATFEQDHDSAIGGTLLYDVDYTYAKATSGRNTLRRTGMELPNGDDVAYTYSSSAHDAAASRVSTVTLDIGGGAVTIAGYDYNGAGHLVGTDYPAIEVMSLKYGSTSGAYPDLDRFDRVTSSRWTKDLATDRDLYDLDVTYDRDSNILRVEDHVQTGFDVAYTMDDLNRLVVADQGTWSGSAITSTTRTEDWTLDQVGNWDEYDLDEDGDATLELNETRGHTLANELNSRNINSTGPAEFEPEYDGAGHLVDDTEDYAYVWDAFGRLRQVKETGTGDLVAEYTYNGLGYRIGWHYDADVDGDVDGSDPWYRFVYDERWRIVATYRGSDSEPKEQFVHHAAGDSGYGTASYIDDVILRDRDDNSGWTSAADGTLEERVFHCQNWRHDVVALIDATGAQVEMARYSPYGVPFGLPAGDLDSDGDVDTADLTVFDALVAYDVRADLDLDGDYDATDRSTINANRGTSAGLGVLSQSAVGNRRGPNGGQSDGLGQVLDRGRVESPRLGVSLHRPSTNALWSGNDYLMMASAQQSSDDPWDPAWGEAGCDWAIYNGCWLHPAWGPLLEEAREAAVRSCGRRIRYSCRLCDLKQQRERGRIVPNCFPPDLYIHVCDQPNLYGQQGVCQVLLHELIHARQYCDLGFFIGNCVGAAREFQDPHRCVELEFEAYRDSGSCPDSDMTCCEQACSSCEEYWTLPLACYAWCLQRFVVEW